VNSQLPTYNNQLSTLNSQFSIFNYLLTSPVPHSPYHYNLNSILLPEIRVRRQALTAAWGGCESENDRKSSKAPTASAVSQLADGTTLLRFSLFSESGVKHSAGLSFSLVRFFWKCKRNEQRNSPHQRHIPLSARLCSIIKHDRGVVHINIRAAGLTFVVSIPALVFVLAFKNFFAPAIKNTEI